MKNIKWSNIFIIVISLIFIGFIVNLITSFYGNPVTAAIATSKIRTYVEDTYPNMDLDVPKANYNFKFTEYVSHVESKTSMDTRFMVAWSKGRIYDSYEGDVAKRYTTFERLQHEFTKIVEDIIEKEFHYETSIVFADLGKAEVGLSSLALDMPLDISNPPLPAALTIYILSNEISYEYLSARILELYGIMEEHQIPIDVFSVVIEEPLPEGEKSAPGGQSIHLLDFPTEKIMSENLIETMKEHQDAWENEANHKK
jgi:hypothetical protein